MKKQAPTVAYVLYMCTHLSQPKPLTTKKQTSSPRIHRAPSWPFLILSLPVYIAATFIYPSLLRSPLPLAPHIHQSHTPENANGRTDGPLPLRL